MMHRQERSKLVKLNIPGESELTNLSQQISKGLFERGVGNVYLKGVIAFCN